MGLVQAVGEAGADQGQVRALDAEHELGGGGDVGDRVLDRDLGRQGLAGLLGRHLLAGDDDDRLDALGRVEPGGGDDLAVAREQTTKPP